MSRDIHLHLSGNFARVTFQPPPEEPAAQVLRLDTIDNAGVADLAARAAKLAATTKHIVLATSAESGPGLGAMAYGARAAFEAGATAVTIHMPALSAAPRPPIAYKGPPLILFSGDLLLQSHYLSGGGFNWPTGEASARKV